MLQSFFVYITLGLILYSLGYLAHIRQKNNLLLNKKTPFWTWEVALALLAFAFVAGVRWNVGVDHQSYLANYLNYQVGGEGIFDKEIGFDYITQLMARRSEEHTSELQSRPHLVCRLQLEKKNRELQITSFDSLMIAGQTQPYEGKVKYDNGSPWTRDFYKTNIIHEIYAFVDNRFMNSNRT